MRRPSSLAPYMLPGSSCEDHRRDEPNEHHAWEAWADELGKTHDMYRCAQCGFWKVWAPKKAKVI